MATSCGQRFLLRTILAIAVAASAANILAAQNPTSTAQPSPDTTPYPIATSKKGLQVQMVDDAIALGIQHAAVNVALGQLLSLTDEHDAIAFDDHQGHRYWFRRAAVQKLDQQVLPLSKAGILVSAILLATQTNNADEDALLVHSRCQGRAPNGIGAFQTATPAGRAWLAAVTEFLAQRYTGQEAKHGRIWNWIVGNEVNSHWWWYHMGRASMQDVAQAYEQAVRIVHGAVRRHSQHGRVFVSLEHHWNKRFAAGDAQQAFAGRAFLSEFAALVRTGGELDWHVAFHPYPENLFDCRFWQDQTAPDQADAHRVTFRNLQVLLRFLKTPELLHRDQPRRVILSEQGFHCADTADGERDQAAAFALAWSIVTRLPGIDAFILHRHVDHAHEGGLKLGLWTNRANSICAPDRKRRIYQVFAACDTDRWPACATFALPVLGLQSFADWPLVDDMR
jgi:hypothetical protein